MLYKLVTVDDAQQKIQNHLNEIKKEWQEYLGSFVLQRIMSYGEKEDSDLVGKATRLINRDRNALGESDLKTLEEYMSRIRIVVAGIKSGEYALRLSR